LKIKGKNLKIWFLLLTCLTIGLPAVWVVSVRMEGTPPVLTVRPETLTIGAEKTIRVSVADENNGLRRLWIGLFKNGREVVLFEKDFPGMNLIRGGEVRESSFDIRVEPSKIGISDGRAMLRLMVTDYSWRRWWHGNQAYREIDVVIDTKPPEIEVLTRVHNLSQGGTGVVIYKVSEPCPESGVSVGDNFFPGHFGHFDDKLTAIAFFALAHDQGKGTRISARAVDRAGNSTEAGFPHHIRRKVFKKDTIRISDRFLTLKMPEFASEISKAAGSSLLAQFLEVNRDLRRANYAKVQSIGTGTEAKLFWKGPFLRLPNSATRAGFADQRKYLYDGKTVDHQVHLGIDLASVAHSPVPAANSGKVAFAGTIGIYGKTVFLDHGFGLFSMYSHLNGIDVQVGQMVVKKDIIGRTGKTGMAGGDHLHFSILVHNTFVNPIEWWDRAWIRNNITTKLKAYE